MNYLLIFLIWSGIAIKLFIATFVFFVAIMKMREMQDVIFTLHWSVRWVCFAILAIGLVLDTLLNWIVLSITFYEFLSTARVIRHKFHSEGFRKIQALWGCKNFLTPFDSKHCE